MQVKQTSWHYRAVVWLLGHPNYVPNNICPYMRKLFRALGKMFVIAVAVVALSYIAIWSLAAPLLVLVNHYVTFLPPDWMAVDAKGQFGPFRLAFIIGCTAYAVATFIGLLFLGVYVKDKLPERERKHVHKEPGLVSTYVRSFHDKTCVPLEFVDPNEKPV
jgi:hypothetical protein